ncbi:MAG TPA: hypothetical protein VJ926_00610 [Patescibacteria group bacterium]|nr:hypothetical protein [Patescibacteria group bacterium]
MIELLVSIGIIVLISGLFLASYRTANKQAELTRSVSDLSSSYRKALNQTLGLSEFDGTVPEGGWGVHIDLNYDTTKYYVFADRDNNGQFDDGEANQEAGGEIINTPRNIDIDSIVINGTNVSYLDVIYIPPYPTIILYSPDITGEITEAEITMLNSETGNTRAVEVNFLGLVDMLD